MAVSLRSLMAVVLLLASAAAADPFAGDKPKATVELLVAADIVRPGDTIAVGVKFTMQPGWHVYWQNPGDAGQPPTFSWNLPDGFEASTPAFPTPIAFESSGLVGYGYAKSVIFPATLTVPTNPIAHGGDLTIAVSYLICDDERCVPESAIATADVTLGGSTEIKKNVLADVEAAKAGVPLPRRLENQEPGSVVVTLDGVTDVALFPLPPADVEATPGEASRQDEPFGTTYTMPIETRKLGGGEVNPFPAVVGYTDAEGHRRGFLVTIRPAGAAASAD